MYMVITFCVIMDHDTEFQLGGVGVAQHDEVQLKAEPDDDYEDTMPEDDTARSDNNHTASFALRDDLFSAPSESVESGRESPFDEVFSGEAITDIITEPAMQDYTAAPKNGFFYSGNLIARSAPQKRTKISALPAPEIFRTPGRVRKTSKTPRSVSVHRSANKNLTPATFPPKRRKPAEVAEAATENDAYTVDELPSVSLSIGGILGDCTDESKDFDSSKSVTEDDRGFSDDGSDDLSVADDYEKPTSSGSKSKAPLAVKRNFAGLPLRDKLPASSVSCPAKGVGLPDDYKSRTRIERRRAVVQYYCGDGNKNALATIAHFKSLRWPYRSVQTFLSHYDKTGSIQRKTRCDAHNYAELGDKLLKLFHERGDKFSGKEAMIELGINKNAYWRVCEKHEGFKKALFERNLEAELINEAKRSVIIEKFLAADGDYRERRNACVRYFWKMPGFYQTFIFESVDRFVRSGSIRSNDRSKQSTWSSADAHGALLRLVPTEERYMLKLQATQAEIKCLLNSKKPVARRKTNAGLDEASDKEHALIERNALLEKLLAKSETTRLAAVEEIATLRAEVEQWKLWASTVVVDASTVPPTAPPT